MLTERELKLLRLIVEAPGAYGTDLPRGLRSGLKALELGGFIVYGPSGWIPTASGETEARRQPDVPAQ